MSDDSRLMTSLLPALLVAIASVLVDATFRSDAFRDRIWAQILLWLAASLQSDNGASITLVLIHATFSLSLISAGYQAFMVQCRWASSEADYTRFLAPSMILPLLYSCVYLNPSPSDLRSASLQCLALFGLAFTSLCGRQWTRLRKRRVRHELIGIPTVESIPVFSSSTGSLEERSWMDWTPSQVLTWIRSLEGEEWSSVCSQLAPERIPGCVLGTLTVSDLRSMGLPYGPAQCLVVKIAELTSEYPSLRRTNAYRDRQQHELEVDEWLGDAIPRSPSTSQAQQQWSHQEPDESFPVESQSARDPQLAPTIPGELNEDAIQKAKDLFRDQFGLELPEIKMRPPADSDAPASDAGGRYDSASEPASAPNVDAAEPQSHPITDFPQDLLDSMPPHVREVAEQRPDLVEMLWKEKQRGKSATALGLSRIHQLRMQDPAYASRFTGAQAAAEVTGIPVAHGDHADSNTGEEDLPDQNGEGERTGLLRKRNTRPPKYSAIR